MNHLLGAVLIVLLGVFAGFVHARIGRVTLAGGEHETSTSSSDRYTSRGHPFITIDYGGELFRAKCADFVDAGSAAERQSGRIPGAVAISLDEFSNGGYPARLEALSRDRTIVVYCASGCSSAEYVAQRIREFGFEKTLILAEGFAAWKAAGLPVEGSDR